MSLSKQLVTSILGLALLVLGAAKAEAFSTRLTSNESSSDTRKYRVIVNHEEQYSIWPADRELPRGWKADGRTGSFPKLQRYLTGVWTDMRPLSIRREASRSGRDDVEYRVVINHEEQYSIWFADREFASGWKDTGTRGPLARCQRYVEEVWTDMRPLSVR